jgi:hypothetical protein
MQLADHLGDARLLTLTQLLAVGLPASRLR